MADPDTNNTVTITTTVDEATPGLVVVQTESKDPTTGAVTLTKVPTFPYNTVNEVFILKTSDTGEVTRTPLATKLNEMDAKIGSGAVDATTVQNIVVNLLTGGDSSSGGTGTGTGDSGGSTDQGTGGTGTGTTTPTISLAATTTRAGVIMIAETSDITSDNKATTPAYVATIRAAMEAAGSGMSETQVKSIVNQAMANYDIQTDIVAVRRAVNEVIATTDFGKITQDIETLKGALNIGGGVASEVSYAITLEVPNDDFYLISGNHDALLKRLWI